eukprot:524879-Pelagomonas_calceolata.AAC.6
MQAAKRPGCLIRAQAARRGWPTVQQLHSLNLMVGCWLDTAGARGGPSCWLDVVSWNCKNRGRERLWLKMVAHKVGAGNKNGNTSRPDLEHEKGEGSLCWCVRQATKKQNARRPDLEHERGA